MENEPTLLHQCGQCYGKFETEEAYLAHACPETGVNPTHPQSMGPNYAAIQAAALERGANSLEVSPEHQPLNIVQPEEAPSQATDTPAAWEAPVADPEVVGEPETSTTSEVPVEAVEVPASQEQPLPPMAPDLIIE